MLKGLSFSYLHISSERKKKDYACTYLAFSCQLPNDFEHLTHTITLYAALNVNTEYATSTPLLKEVSIHPPNASRILLPDGRYLGYREQGVPSVRARHSMIAPHSFLSSRLSGRIILAYIWILKIMREGRGNSET